MTLSDFIEATKYLPRDTILMHKAADDITLRPASITIVSVTPMAERVPHQSATAMIGQGTHCCVPSDATKTTALLIK